MFVSKIAGKVPPSPNQRLLLCPFSSVFLRFYFIAFFGTVFRLKILPGLISDLYAIAFDRETILAWNRTAQKSCMTDINVRSGKIYSSCLFFKESYFFSTGHFKKYRFMNSLLPNGFHARFVIRTSCSPVGNFSFFPRTFNLAPFVLKLDVEILFVRPAIIALNFFFRRIRYLRSSLSKRSISCFDRLPMSKMTGSFRVLFMARVAMSLPLANSR